MSAFSTSFCWPSSWGARSRSSTPAGAAPHPASRHAAASAAVQTALQGYFTGERLGKAVLLSELHALLHQVEGLENYHILAPAADVAAAVGTLPVLGQVQLSAMT